MSEKHVYFAGLNGLRAIAALGVVISHITQHLDNFHLNPRIFGSFADGKPIGLLLGSYGVTLFFALSGFLITYLLQAERDIQPIDISKFYMRRILRIWPLYYLYLTICILVLVIFAIPFNAKVLPFYIFYTANIPFILGEPISLMAHYWSLGSEEQFYLVWPWINKNATKNLVPLIIFLIIAIVGTKLLLHCFHPHTMLESVLDNTRFYCMLVGALGAILYKRGNRLFMQLTDNWIAQVICWFIFFMITINRFHIASFIDNEIVSIASLVLIIGQIKIKHRIINLEIKVMDFLGRISYGIYVIHPLLIFFFGFVFGRLDIPPLYKYILVYTVILFTTILLAYLSYHYFERYFLRLKKKFVVVDSSPVKHGAIT
jgi:peptidoglycan/LPS O-acetylase OafA/YrhL